MAVLPEDLRAPNGLLELAMYPGKTVEEIDEILDAYITQGEARASDDEVDEDSVDAAVAAWAYHRAFQARAIQLASMPASVTIPNEESISRTADQRAMFERLSREWSDTYYGLLPIEDEGTGSVVPPTGSTPTQVNW